MCSLFDFCIENIQRLKQQKKQQINNEMNRINRLLLQEKLNVSETIDDVIHYYCQQHQQDGGISKKGWLHGVTFLYYFVPYTLLYFCLR